MTDTTVSSACPHDCPDTCAMLTTVRDGKAIEVRGNPDHPFTQGGLCVKVNSLFVYNSNPAVMVPEQDKVLQGLERIRFARKRSSHLSLTAAGLRPAPPRRAATRAGARDVRRIRGGPLSRPVARPSKSDALQNRVNEAALPWADRFSVRRRDRPRAEYSSPISAHAASLRIARRLD